MFVAGSYKSAVKLAVAVSSLLTDPPVASTLPFGRMVALIWMRARDIAGPLCHTGVGADKLMISVVAVAGLAPPMLITRGV